MEGKCSKLQGDQWDHTGGTSRKWQHALQAKVQGWWRCPGFPVEVTWAISGGLLGVLSARIMSDLNNLCRDGVVNWDPCSLNREGSSLRGSSSKSELVYRETGSRHSPACFTEVRLATVVSS